VFKYYKIFREREKNVYRDQGNLYYFLNKPIYLLLTTVHDYEQIRNKK